MPSGGTQEQISVVRVSAANETSKAALKVCTCPAYNGIMSAQKGSSNQLQSVFCHMCSCCKQSQTEQVSLSLCVELATQVCHVGLGSASSLCCLHHACAGRATTYYMRRLALSSDAISDLTASQAGTANVVVGAAHESYEACESILIGPALQLCPALLCRLTLLWACSP